MKFLLLKAFLLSRRKDQGFILPIVIGIGFVMVLLGTVSLVQSGEESLNAVSQQGSSDSLAMAEIGAARYRNLLNNNRALAVSDLAGWVSLENQTCDAITNLADINVWQDITVSGTAIGSYRLVDYQYDQNPNDGILTDDNNFDQIDDANNDFNGDGNSDARGFLTIQGKDTPGANVGNSSISQIQVEIPLGVNTTDLDDLNPALWIAQRSVTNLGNSLDLNGANLVYKEPSLAGANGCTITGTDAVTGVNITGDARDLPPIATIPVGATSRTLAPGNITNNNANTQINNFDPTENKIILGTSLDDSGTTAALEDFGTSNPDDDIYFYQANGLELTANQAIISDGTSEVILLVNGNLTINTGSGGDEVRLVNSSHVSETGAATPNDVDRFFEIHVTGDVDITGDGDLDITGLLRVDGAVNISDSVNVNVTGAIWANDWNNTSSGTVDIATDGFRFYSITPNRTPAPLTYRPSGWVTQEAS